LRGREVLVQKNVKTLFHALIARGDNKGDRRRRRTKIKLQAKWKGNLNALGPVFLFS
jgi:hypothetical protein